MKKINLTFRAIHPPIILILATWFVLFWLGYKFPEYIKFLIIFFVAVITIIFFRVSKKVTTSKKLIIGVIATLLVFVVLYSNLFSSIMSFFLGIFLTWVLGTDAKNRYKEYVKVYNKIKNIDLKDSSVIGILTEQRPAWCTREVAKAAFLRRGGKYHQFAKNHYRNKGYRFWNIFPDGGIKVWFNPRFWRRIGI